MKPLLKQILRVQLDESLTKLNATVVYINQVHYRIFRGRIIAIRERNGKLNTNPEYLFNLSLSVYM